MPSNLRRSALPVVLIGLLVMAAGCSGCGLIDAVANRISAWGRGEAPTVVASLPETVTEPTLRPGVPEISDLDDIPDGPGNEFALRVSEEDLNARLEAQEIEYEGLMVSQPRMVLAEGQIIVTLMVTHEQTGVNFGLEARLTPHVVDGDVYIRIEDLSLDDSAKGVTRVFLESALDQAIKRLATDEGMRLPMDEFDRVEVEDVYVVPGYLLVYGRTRS